MIRNNLQQFIEELWPKLCQDFIQCTFDLSSCSHAFWLLYKSLAVCLSANLPLMCLLKSSLWLCSIFTLFLAASCFNTSFTSICLFNSTSRPRPPRSEQEQKSNNIRADFTAACILKTCFTGYDLSVIIQYGLSQPILESLNFIRQKFMPRFHLNYR